MFFFKKNSSIQHLIVFLGNPGDKYENTRHNAGFMVADTLSGQLNLPIQRHKFKSLTATALLGDQNVLLMKPMTYMNLSGEAVKEAAHFYKILPEHILVVSDEVAFPTGKLRLRKGGSAGGHNGLKNINLHLGTDQYPRLRVGVGQKPHPDYDMADWVLGRFQGEDLKIMEDATKRGIKAIEITLKEGIDAAMSQFN